MRSWSEKVNLPLPSRRFLFRGVLQTECLKQAGNHEYWCTMSAITW